MNLTLFLVTFQAIASVNADESQNSAQLAASQNDQVDVVSATPAPTTFSPTPAPTNFNLTFSTESVNLIVTPAPTTPNREEVSQTTKSSAGVVGVAYSTTGTVGTAYVTTREEYEAQNANEDFSDNSYTVPIVVVGCLVGVLGMVAAVVMKKRKTIAEESETDYSNAIHTPSAL